jgi:hypothetical protein
LLTVLFSLYHQLLTLHPALRVGQQEPQPDGHEGPQAPQSVVGRGLDDLLGLVLLLVEHVLVLHCEVVAMAASHRIAKWLPLQGQLPGSDVHDLHILRTMHGVCKTHTRQSEKSVMRASRHYAKQQRRTVLDISQLLST